MIHHPRNHGYGAAVRTGLAACRYEWICFTDGDDEYDLYDLKKLWRLRDYYDLIITFRYVRRYSGLRIVVSRSTTVVLRRLFFTRFRDVSTGLRLVRKDAGRRADAGGHQPVHRRRDRHQDDAQGLPGRRDGDPDVPPRVRAADSTTPENIYRTIVDMVRCHRRVFSQDYELPTAGICGSHREQAADESPRG